MTIRRARLEDLPEIMSIYQSLIGTTGCTWDEDYPTPEFARADIEKCSLYLLEDDNQRILAVATAADDPDLDDFECWDKQVKNWFSLSRVGVCQTAQGQGLAQQLITVIIDELKKTEDAGLRLLVAKENFPAIALYQKLGFERVGTGIAYGEAWYCYELILSR